MVGNIKSKEKIEMANDLLKKAKAYLENSKGLEDVFKESIDNKSGRYIVFCRDLEHLEKMYDESSNWFTGVNRSIHKYKIARDMSKDTIIKELNTFERDDTKALKLLFCINMLNEGYHLDNIDGALLLRATVSPNVYLQQIGRAISANANSTPLIVDVVNNANCLRLSEDLETEINRVLRCNIGNTGFGERFSIIALEREFTDILEKIQSISRASFETYYEVLKQYKEEYGTTPINTKTKYKGYSIGAYIVYGRISEENRRKIEQLGLVIEVGNHSIQCTDHLGNKFKSIEDMCKYWKITRATYENRRRQGWSQKDTLETPLSKIYSESCTDHLGNHFKNITDMCKYWKIGRSTYENRRRQGWSQEKALTTPVDRHK